MAVEEEGASARPPAEGEDMRLRKVQNWTTEREVTGKAGEMKRERCCHCGKEVNTVLRPQLRRHGWIGQVAGEDGLARV